jgi:hypothetical protein
MSYYLTKENSVLNINNAHLKVSGNIQTDVMKLGAIEFAPPASDVAGTVNFTNVTTGVTTSSNLNVGGTLMLGSVELVTATAALEQTVNLGNVTSNTVQFTNATTGIVATGNVEASKFIGDGSLLTGITSGSGSSASNLQVVTDTGNVTSNTVQFSNAITGFVTTANIEVGTANLFVDTSSSRVGIGGDNPDGKLHVFTSSGDANSTDNALFIGGPENCTGIPNLRLGCHQTPNYAWMQSHCSSALCLNPLGGTNVGIWTSSPKTTLHVKNETDSSGAGDAYISGKTKKPTECLRLQGKYYSTGSGALLRFTNQHNSGTNPNTSEYNLAGIAGYDHDNSWGGGLTFYTSPGSGSGGDDLTSRMTINEAGNVGINTTNPLARLEVIGAPSVSISSGSYKWFHYNNNLTTSNGSWGNACIYGNGHIVSGGALMSHAGTIGASDERIKKDIIDVEDGAALVTLRLLKPKQYKYRDEVQRGTEPVWGFIAQEVGATLPYATQTRTDCLPNIYQLANVSGSNVITFTNFDTSNLESNMTVLKVYDVDDAEHLVNIAEIVDERSVRVDEDLSEWYGTVDGSEGDKIFVYGQQVDDFVFLKKDAIWTVATSALQEVDRQLQAEKARNDALEARILALENA